MLFKISIKYYITIIFSLLSFVKRYAVRNVKIRQYAVRRVKIRQYAVRKGEGGVTLIICGLWIQKECTHCITVLEHNTC